ncbi:MAG: bifunctional phosphopantothenoylcysteine decarboxylase/phosphopantothenate--cysteine ligase CoaBC [Desulfovibrio sp.]|nr:bifunctional phosphopantothenoylcysteine decarboxylase/phosphopantothenate--cysteine ligase CoaBC [Desulfovibrio sp.]
MPSPVLFDDTTLFAHRRLHLALSGSVACYKICDLLRAFGRLEVHSSVTLSNGARTFVTPTLFEALGALPVYTDMVKSGEDCFAHLEPGHRAEAMLLAPASANMIAKLANGMACDMVSAQALAFPGPLLFAPAMNPTMWANPSVRENVTKLRERGCLCIFPEGGKTACGDEGTGKLAALEELFWAVLRVLSPSDMEGKKILITLGPTREYVDGVRFLSNPSSGRMGASLALACYLRKAIVHVLAGPGVDFTLPRGITRYNVTTAREMYEKAEALWPDMDMGMFAAAVADFAPHLLSSGKVKKQNVNGALSLSLDKNPDILASLAAVAKPEQKILAFAAETTDSLETLIPLALEKHRRKGASILAANRVNGSTGAFGARENTMVVVDRRGEAKCWPTMRKSDLAWRLCSCLLEQ